MTQRRSISQKLHGKAIDFKCGTQFLLPWQQGRSEQISPKEEAWPKYTIYRLPANGHDENVGHRNHQDAKNSA